jgi:hypothetical protein
MDGRRTEEDLVELERRAEATWIAERLGSLDGELDPGTVAAILRLHREYLSLPPPDRLLVDGEPVALDGDPFKSESLDVDPDRQPDEVGDDGGRGADEDLPSAGEQHAAAGQEADGGADREQRRE